jgi:DNA modification methylase
MKPAYKTKAGQLLNAKIEDALHAPALLKAAGKVNLIMTSPPFPLVRKKKYGNETGQEYVAWLKGLAPRLASMLAEDGSIVIEIGNAWQAGNPVMSTLPLEALLAFKEAGKLELCQHVICHNPARLPSPAAWVNIERIRLKDSFTHVWWLAKTQRPKADNRRVLTPYSKDMLRLLSSKKYNAGRRPSGHKISETGFLKDHGGAISPNVIDPANVPGSLMSLSNTGWDARYRKFCALHGLEPHPARMQPELAGFFIQFLTEPNDLIVDPFAGSNTTGAVAETLGRRWLCVEADEGYSRGSQGRFEVAARTKKANDRKGTVAK